jgi:hypothetical protein
MITYLQFIDELKEIKTSLKSNTTNQLLFIKLDEMITKYEAIVDEHEQQENA